MAVYYSSKIRACLGWWKAQKAPRLTVSVLRNGYKIPFATLPPHLRKSPVMVADSDVDFILDDLSEGSQVGAYIPLEGQGKEYLARGRVDRKAGKPLLILNFRHVNAYVRKQEARYQSLNDLRRVLTPDCWMFTESFSMVMPACFLGRLTLRSIFTWCVCDAPSFIKTSLVPAFEN